MLARNRRTAVFAGLLTSVLCWPAMSAELAVEQSLTSETSAGPVIARETLGKATAAHALVREAQLTRATANPAARLRSDVSYRAAGPALMLGIGY